MGTVKWSREVDERAADGIKRLGRTLFRRDNSAAMAFNHIGHKIQDALDKIQDANGAIPDGCIVNISVEAPK